eukprot:4926098-Ditylum_brightwellii.AAC.1
MEWPGLQNTMHYDDKLAAEFDRLHVSHTSNKDCTRQNMHQRTKYYMVARRHNIGVYNEWYGPFRAQKEVNKYMNCMHKRFKTHCEA